MQAEASGKHEREERWHSRSVIWREPLGLGPAPGVRERERWGEFQSRSTYQMTVKIKGTRLCRAQRLPCVYMKWGWLGQTGGAERRLDDALM